MSKKNFLVQSGYGFRGVGDGLGDQAGNGWEEEGRAQADEGELPSEDADFHGQACHGPE